MNKQADYQPITCILLVDNNPSLSYSWEMEKVRSISVDASKLKMHLRVQGMTLVGLAQAAGITRQAIYQMLRPGYRPVNSGLEAVANALGMNPMDLLYSENEGKRRVRAVNELVNRASSGDARAFELLPATLLGLDKEDLPALNTQDSTGHQLLAAAGELAKGHSNKSWLTDFIRFHGSSVKPCQAFFFGESLISPDRLVNLTPAPLQAHRVFGAFETDAFSRHMT